MALNGPPFAWPGFRSNVSIWLGPPFIQSRMHDRLRCGLDAASAASAFSHPAGAPPETPAAAQRSHCLRVKSNDRALRVMTALLIQWLKTNSALASSDQSTSARAFLVSRV